MVAIFSTKMASVGRVARKVVERGKLFFLPNWYLKVVKPAENVANDTIQLHVPMKCVREWYFRLTCTLFILTCQQKVLENSVYIYPM